MAKSKTNDQDAIDSEFQALLEKQRAPQEQELVAEYVRMFKRTRYFAKRIERSMHDGEFINSRDVYALNTLYNQQREIIADLRTFTDLSEHVALISQNVFDPLQVKQGTFISAIFYQFRSLMQHVAKPDQLDFAYRQTEALLRELAKGLSAEINNSSDLVTDILLGGVKEDKPKQQATRSKKTNSRKRH